MSARGVLGIAKSQTYQINLNILIRASRKARSQSRSQNETGEKGAQRLERFISFAFCCDEIRATGTNGMLICWHLTK